MLKTIVYLTGAAFILAALHRLYKIQKLLGKGKKTTGQIVDIEAYGGVWSPILGFKTDKGENIKSKSYGSDEKDIKTGYKAIVDKEKIEIVYNPIEPKICMTKEEYISSHLKMIFLLSIGMSILMIGKYVL